MQDQDQLYFLKVFDSYSLGAHHDTAFFRISAIVAVNMLDSEFAILLSTGHESRAPIEGNEHVLRVLAKLVMNHLANG